MIKNKAVLKATTIAAGALAALSLAACGKKENKALAENVNVAAIQQQSAYAAVQASRVPDAIPAATTELAFPDSAQASVGCASKFNQMATFAVGNVIAFSTPGGDQLALPLTDAATAQRVTREFCAKAQNAAKPGEAHIPVGAVQDGQSGRYKIQGQWDMWTSGGNAPTIDKTQSLVVSETYSGLSVAYAAPRP